MGSREDLVIQRIFFELFMLESSWGFFVLFFVCFFLLPLNTSGIYYVLRGLLLWKMAGGPVALSASQPCKSREAQLGGGQGRVSTAAVEIQTSSSGT